MMHAWQPLQADTSETALEQVLEHFQQIYEQYLAHDPMLNHALPLVMRGWRENGDWFEGLLLTPWMLAQVYFPRQSPPEPLPAGWDAASRQTAGYQVIGPLLDVDIGEERPAVHLNYDAVVGHYVLRPLIQSLTKYRTENEVFGAWSDVLAARQAYRQQFLEEQDLARQEKVSRRDFMTRWLRS